MPREFITYLEDIEKAIGFIKEFSEGLSSEDFRKDLKSQHAILRNLQIIGEATKNIPDHIRNRKPDIEWRKIAGFRDFLVHAYFEVDLEIVWEVIQEKIPDLDKAVSDLLQELS